MHRLLVFMPLLTGCLLNFSPFEEDAFISAYSDAVCTTYADCIDGMPDGQSDAANGMTPSAFDTCADWVRTPQQQDCDINSERALQCYEELNALLETVRANDDCAPLWADGALPACNATYLNCVTDKPFGSLPPSTSTEPPVIDTATPLHGPVSGGTRVTITGSGFGSDTQVLFGGTAAEIVSHTEAQLEAITPALGEGAVPISVSTTLGQTDATQTYRYWTDIPEKTGILGWMYTYETVGNYMDEMDSITAGAVLFLEDVDPDVIHFHDVLGISTSSGCETVTTGGSIVTPSYITPQYPDMVFQDASRSFSLSYAGPGSFDYYSQRNELTAGDNISLTAESFGGWPALSFAPVLKIPPQTTPLTPELTASDIPEVIIKAAMPVTWVAEGSTYVTVRLSQEDTFSEFVGCVFGDKANTSGNRATHDIATSRLESLFKFPTTLYMELCRVNEQTNNETSPYNNGRVDFSGVQCILGAVRVDN